MRFDILTLFPDMFESVFRESIIRRAVEAGLVSIHLHNIRDYALDKHHVTDDAPYGGGGGMVMKVEPVILALEVVVGAERLAAQKRSGEVEAPVVLLTPAGRLFSQEIAREYERVGRIVLICGRYEGLDERAITLGVTDEVSIGDYVLSGGEIPAMAIVEAVTRLVPGVLGDMRALVDDSHASGLLEYPHYTRPATFRGLAVPDILLSGNHAQVERWRREQALRRTYARRPDLLARAALSARDRAFLNSLREPAPPRDLASAPATSEPRGSPYAQALTTTSEEGERPMSKRFRGYYGIAMTPFNERGDILWDELEKEADWVVRAGAHGLVWPVNDSEFTRLAFPERMEGIKRVVDAVGGRIPVIIGVADVFTTGAVRLAEASARAGADAVIALPPARTTMALDRALIKAYYRAIAEAGGLPVMIQNLSIPLGADLSTEFIVELCEEIPLVELVKEERELQRQRVSEIVAARSPAIKAIFGGGTVLGLVDGHKRGADGYLAASYVPDIDAQIWDLMEAGDEAGARRVEDALAVLEKARRGTPEHYVDRKQILVWRGVFSCNVARIGTRPLDDAFLAELRYGYQAVEPYFRV